MAGFVKSNFEIKVVVLYILSKVPDPLAFDELLDIAQSEEDINYFLLKQSVEELIVPENILQQEEGYSITPRGRENLDNFLYILPDSIKGNLDAILTDVIRAQTTRRNIKSFITEHPDTTSEINLQVLDARGVLMDLKLITANVTESEIISKAFHNDPSLFFREVMEKVRTLSGLET